MRCCKEERVLQVQKAFTSEVRELARLGIVRGRQKGPKAVPFGPTITPDSLT